MATLQERTCPECNGEGRVPSDDLSDTGPMDRPYTRTCPECNGSGKV